MLTRRLEESSAFTGAGVKPILVVTMATSRQGRAVIRHISKQGLFQVRALTRDPSSKSALEIAKLPNVEVLKSDLLDIKSLKTHFAGAYGIFGNTTPTKGWLLGRGSMVKSYELEQGRNLVDAVKEIKKAGILQHFVFSSVCKPKDPLKSNPAPGHFSTKWSIEDYINSNGLKEITTILRPVSYFENFDSDLPGIQISERFFPGVVHPDKKWQTIAVDDIGLWTMAVFSNPKKFLGSAINIAGEEMTGNEMAALLSKLRGPKLETVKYLKLPRIMISLLEHDIAIMAEWIERASYGANLPELKSLAADVGITLTPLSTWLKNKTSKEISIQKDKDTSFMPVEFEAIAH